MKDLQILIKGKLYDFRGTKVMLDSDLAEYYGIETKRLNLAVKRNPHLFPDDFMFQLTDEETKILRTQFVTSKGGARYNPHVFTEKGAWAVSFIFNSKEISEKGIQLIRILERLRDFALQHQDSLPSSTAYQLTSPTSAVNIYNYGTVQVQQGNYNQQNITQLKDVVYTLQEIKEKSNSPEFDDKLDSLISALMKKEEKSKVLTAMEAVIAVAKGTKTVMELGKLVTAAIGAYLGLGL
jgi:hypothetical protein